MCMCKDLFEYLQYGSIKPTYSFDILSLKQKACLKLRENDKSALARGGKG